MTIWIITIIALIADLALLVASIIDALVESHTIEQRSLGFAQVAVTLFIVLTTSLPAFIRTVRQPRKGSLLALVLALVLPTLTVLIFTDLINKAANALLR